MDAHQPVVICFLTYAKVIGVIEETCKVVMEDFPDTFALIFLAY
jgi:hypothetical protein